MSNLPPASRSFPHRFRCGPGPRRRLDVWARDADEAAERAGRMRSMIAALVKAGRVKAAIELASDAAAARHIRDFAAIERAAHTAAARPASETPKSAEPALTYREVVRRHLAGELHHKRPKDIESIKDKGVKALWGVYDGHILNVSLGARGAFGDQPIAVLTKADAMVVRDEIGPDYSDGMYRIICSAIRRPFLNAEMFGWIDRSPIPVGFVPPAGKGRIGTYMHPDEDQAYLGHRQHPLVDRVAYGFGARNGCRPGEVEAAEVRDVDFKRGTFKLPKNKTNSPREWKLEPDSLRALRLIVGPDAKPTDKLFPGFVNNATRFREQVRATPGCDRARLFEDSALERPICPHHAMRGSFVTLALANAGTPEGQHRTEQWVRDRTGHCTSKEIEGYRKDARMAVEHEQRWLAPLDQAIPELRKLGALHTSKAAAGCAQPTGPKTRGASVGSHGTPAAAAVLHDGPPGGAVPQPRVGRGVGQKRVRQPDAALACSPSWSNSGGAVESSTSIRAEKRGGSRPRVAASTPPGPPLEGGVGQPQAPQQALAAYLAALTAAGDLDTAAAVLEAARRRRAPPPDNVASLDDARANRKR